MANYCHNPIVINFWCLLKDQEKQNKESESKVDTEKNVMNWLLQQKPKNGQTNEGLEKSKKEKPKTSKTLVKIVNYTYQTYLDGRFSLSGYEKAKKEEGRAASS